MLSGMYESSVTMKVVSGSFLLDYYLPQDIQIHKNCFDHQLHILIHYIIVLIHKLGSTVIWSVTTYGACIYIGIIFSSTRFII